ncbi:MAG: hypothetical protein WC716_11735 [Chitinophagaceae bacterium]
MFGNEGFSSYEQSLTATFIEKIGKFVSVILIVFACILFILVWADRKKVAEYKEKSKTESKNSNR